jgi:hypothetical protein
MKLKVNRRSADVRLTPNYGGQPSPAGGVSRSSGVSRAKAGGSNTIFDHAGLAGGASRSSGVSRAKAGGSRPTIQPLLASSLSRDGSIVPLGRSNFPHDSRHFVPGSYHAVPLGQNTFSPPRI